jgi:hypothetical protein
MSVIGENALTLMNFNLEFVAAELGKTLDDLFSLSRSGNCETADFAHTLLSGRLPPSNASTQAVS